MTRNDSTIAPDYRASTASTRVFLTAEWRYLAMLNYEIDLETLRPYVPAGTEVDQWRGRTYISIVGFLFRNTRVLGVPIPYHRNFEEVNLRFYVKREVDGEPRRGVVFIKELVPRRAIAWTANALYGENYQAVPMRHRIVYSEGDALLGADYFWHFGRREHQMAITVSGNSREILDGSEEEFITEHYWGYAWCRGQTIEYQVEHPRWRVWPASVAELDCDPTILYGPLFSGALRGSPASAFLAEGSAVTVYQGVYLKQDY